MLGRAYGVEVDLDEEVARTDPLARTDPDVEALAVHLDRVDADVDEHLDAVRGADAEGVAGLGDDGQLSVDRGDDVAPDRLADNLRRWSATPLAGWVVLGSTGEFPMLDAIERDRILAAAREAIPRDRCFIAGTGAARILTRTTRLSRPSWP